MAAPGFRLLLVSDRSLRPDLDAAFAEALRAAPPGRVAVMLREKDLDGRASLDLAHRLREVTARAGALLLVNDRLDVARAAGADGVHLPAAGLPAGEVRRLLPDGLVGVSTHHPDEVRAARDSGADYATFGPVFETPSKRAFGPPVGLAALGRAADLLPLFALGGVEPERVLDCRTAGAHGVAAIRAVLGADDPAAAVRRFLGAWASG